MIEVSRSTLWRGVVGSVGILALAFFWLGLSLDLSKAGAIITIYGLVGFVAIARGRLHLTWMVRLADFVETTTLFSMVSLIGALGSYAVATITTGYYDSLLAAADRALGFDWLSGYHFVAAHPAIAEWTRPIYLTIFLSPTLVIFGLTVTGRAARARSFVGASGVALAITLIGFYLLPGRTAVAFHVGMTPVYMPTTGLHHVEVIDHLRSGILTRIDPTDLYGLITFPSFHMIAALLFMWAAWPVRGLREVCSAINILMILVIPVEGSHYLIDLIGGATVVMVVLIAFYWPALQKRLQAPSIPGTLPAVA